MDNSYISETLHFKVDSLFIYTFSSLFLSMNLISIFDLSSAEIEAILEKAAELKRERSEKIVEGTFPPNFNSRCSFGFNRKRTNFGTFAENIFISLESLSIT